MEKLRYAGWCGGLYDCLDDWQNWLTEPLPGAFSLAEENKLVAESDVLVVSSRELRDRHAADHIESILIPNSADFEFFRGGIADWFDLELMTQVASLRPQNAFVLTGQGHLADISP